MHTHSVFSEYNVYHSIFIHAVLEGMRSVSLCVMPLCILQNYLYIPAINSSALMIMIMCMSYLCHVLLVFCTFGLQVSMCTILVSPI